LLIPDVLSARAGTHGETGHDSDTADD